jgi:hypothetical protein
MEIGKKYSDGESEWIFIGYDEENDLVLKGIKNIMKAHSQDENGNTHFFRGFERKLTLIN